MDCRQMVLSDSYIDVISNYVIPVEYAQVPIEDFCRSQIAEDIYIFYINRSELPEPLVTLYPYFSVPKCYGLMGQELRGLQDNRIFDSQSLESAGILNVQKMPLSLTGRGVICAFIDTGIRYQESVFRRSDGSSRILAIWDQTQQEGQPPEGFVYGSEYTRADINAALMEENPLQSVPSTDTIGHGTALASVAAGTALERDGGFTGAAPDADILVVKCKEAKSYLREYYMIPDDVTCFQETDILQALKYVEQYAEAMRRPVVVMLGIGSSLGDHTGSSPLALYLNTIARRKSRAVICCTGNEGNTSHHYESMVYTNSNPMEILVSRGTQGFIVEIWGRIPAILTITLQSPGGERVSNISFRAGNRQQYGFLYESTIVTVDYILVENNAGDELIFLRFENPTAGIWTVTVSQDALLEQTPITHHAWISLEQFLTAQTYFLTPNPYVTITEPANASNVITVTGYRDSNNSVYPAAGRGFTRMGGIKPDLSAPAVNVSTWNGTMSGTSVAAAITAGAAAQYMQWAVVQENEITTDTQVLKNFLIRGANRSGISMIPSREWGYGRLNLEESFRIYAKLT